MKIASDNWFASPTILPLQMAPLARLFDETTTFDKLDSMPLEIGEPVLNFRDPDKKLLHATIGWQPLDHSLMRFVSLRMLRWFFNDRRGAACGSGRTANGSLDERWQRVPVTMASNGGQLNGSATMSRISDGSQPPGLFSAAVWEAAPRLVIKGGKTPSQVNGLARGAVDHK
jgi:hypothetical protein